MPRRPVAELVRVRVSGDAVRILTNSATNVRTPHLGSAVLVEYDMPSVESRVDFSPPVVPTRRNDQRIAGRVRPRRARVPILRIGASPGLCLGGSLKQNGLDILHEF